MNENAETFACRIEERSGVNDSRVCVDSVDVDRETGQHVGLDEHVTFQQQTFVRKERLVHEQPQGERQKRRRGELFLLLEDSSELMRRGSIISKSAKIPSWTLFKTSRATEGQQQPRRFGLAVSQARYLHSP